MATELYDKTVTRPNMASMKLNPLKTSDPKSVYGVTIRERVETYGMVILLSDSVHLVDIGDKRMVLTSAEIGTVKKNVAEHKKSVKAINDKLGTITAAIQTAANAVWAKDPQTTVKDGIVSVVSTIETQFPEILGTGKLTKINALMRVIKVACTAAKSTVDLTATIENVEL